MSLNQIVGALRLIIISRSGNVGKTTLAKHCFKPRMRNAYCIAVEDRNAALSAYADETIAAEDFTLKVAPRLVRAGKLKEHLLIDIGSSNEAAVNEAMDQLGSIHKYVDGFILACVPDSKVGDDTITTAAELLERGVDPAKIFVVRNKVANKSKLDLAKFAAVEADAAAQGYHVLKTVVVEQGLFETLRGYDETVGEIAAAEVAELPEGSSEKAENANAVRAVMQMQAEGLDASMTKLCNELATLI